MATLEIHVVETVSVMDLVAPIRRVIQKVLDVFNKKPEDLPVKQQEYYSSADTRAPPTLGVNVSDGIKVATKFGG